MHVKEHLTTISKGELDFPPRKVWLKTFGCQMNHHDSERILSYLTELNFTRTEELEEADMVLFNTCAVRELSNNKFYSQLGQIKNAKKKKQNLVVGVGGCVAQTEGKELIKKYRHLDFAFGTDVIDSINDMVYRIYAGDSKFVINSWDRSENFSIQTKITHTSPQAFINIIKGCNKYCTYCIVPYTRGKERSRKRAEVTEDIKRLVEYQGIQEVMLLGQNVNSYGHDNGETLAELLIDLEKIDGLELVRYTTSHPYDVSDDLIAVHGSAKKLSRHLHLPVQSGADSVLTRMHREYTRESYLKLLEKLRKSNPDIVISTDIIVGFVNETEKEFEQTLELLKLARFDSIYSYAYSLRSKTRAAKMEDFLTDDIRGERLRYLQKYQLEIQKELRATLVGKKLTILIDGDGHIGGEHRWRGRSNCNRIVHVLPTKTDKNYQWNWLDVRITKSTALSCRGEILHDHGKHIPSSTPRY